MRSRVKKWMAGVALVTGAALALTGCAGGGGTPPASAEGATLTIAARQDVASFDTGELDTGAQVQYWQPVYDTLLNYTPDGVVEPNMATEFSYNDDNTVLTLKLREGIEFVDGTPFNADAVKANIEHLQQGTGVSVYMVALVENVVVIDDSTVEIHLSAPDPAFTYYLCLVAGAMASPAAFGTPSFATAPVGSGPYTLDKDATIRGSQYTYVRNADYWNAEAFPFDKVVVKPMDDLTARFNALKSGQVNSAELNPTVIDEIEASGLTENSTLAGWLGLIIFDREGEINPALGDVRVRQALNHAVDGESMNRNLFSDSGSASQQIFNPKSPAFEQKFDDRYPFDPAKAKALLAEAGYADGFEITMPSDPGDPTEPYITQQLADIGVTVNWDKVSPENVVSEILQGKYAVASFGSSSGHPWRDISKMIDSQGAWNPLQSGSPELDQLLTDIQMSEGAEQDAAYRAVNEYVTENAWFSVWVFNKAIQVTDSTVAVDMQAGSGVPYLRNYTPAK